ncbi:10450_t:CDS:2 [Racocetra fulgida]|uniref:10450_t:CDS:1 n=1 Tax=Racocetra fulgida TaxID=60492 RepID=A0A9N8VLN4_9GLOM|nr:10450_t:CDS:2 [Racocetra fulgida]
MAEAISEMQKLVKEASDIKYIPGASLKTYFRSANALLRQLPNHPEYKKSEHKAGKVELSKNSMIVLGEIEKLKPILQEHFQHSAEKELIIKDVSLSSIESQKDQTQEYNNTDYHNDESYQNREYDDQNDYQNKSYQSQGLQNQIPESSLDLVEQLKNINLHSTSSEITYHYSAHTPRVVSSQALSFYDAPSSGFPPSVESLQALSPQVIPSPVLSRQIPPSIVPSPVLSRHITPPALPPKVRNEAPQLPPKPNGYSIEEFASNKHVHYDHFKAIKDYGLQPVTNEEDLIEYEEKGLMILVLECTLRGFHPHECDEPIDKEITENGHIIMKRMALDVIDLR